jgi:hypothetical protein
MISGIHMLKYIDEEDVVPLFASVSGKCHERSFRCNIPTRYLKACNHTIFTSTGSSGKSRVGGFSIVIQIIAMHCNEEWKGHTHVMSSNPRHPRPGQVLHHATFIDAIFQIAPGLVRFRNHENS